MKSYQNQTPIMARSGSAPRTICLPQSASKRGFEFQKPKTLNVELKGNLSIKPSTAVAKELTPFRKVTVLEKPNSNRTLIPELGPSVDNTITRSRSVRNILDTNKCMSPGNINNLFLREDSVNKSRRVTNPKVYKSFSFENDLKVQEQQRRNVKEVVYKLYDNTTQIIHLPGGVKRTNKLINDDNSVNPYRNTESYHTKVIRDYNSNISCLPGSKINEAVDKPLIKNRKFLSSDIFNANHDNSYNSFKVSNKKIESVNKFLGQSNEEKKLIQHPKAHRPNYVKNAFDIPFLPGHRFSDPYKQNFHKEQIFKLQTKTCLEKPKLTEEIDPYTISGLSSLTSTVTSERLKNRETKYNESFPRILPQWIKFDKTVLKYYGYIVEHVVESAYENFRIRKCNIYYYLDDDSIHIDEVKEENSGIPQGYLIKRQGIVKEGSETGEKLRWMDINLQSELLIYGKKFRICDCDSFTKNFYNEQGVTLNEPESIPEIDIEDKFKNIDMKQNLENISLLKEYNEVKLGGGHPNKTLKQFIDNDRKVLNFDIVWFDEKYDKEEKSYKMNYYLADGMVEVREMRVSNSGKDPFPYLLRKSKLAKKPVFSYCPGLLTKREEFYTPKDLIVGNYVIIYNRSCLITDCDDFSKRWFKANLGLDVVPIKVKRNPPQKVIHPIPPHNGFGSEEDSMRNVLSLNPQSKLKYVTKMFKSDKHILRFNAKLISPVSADSERKFIVSVFVRDDSIQIFEVADKNSGRTTCKFIERKNQKNPYTNKFYSEKNFLVGNSIYINKYIFKLVECDDYTKKYMRDNPESFRDSDLYAIVNRIRVAGMNHQSLEDYVVELLKMLDRDGKDYVSRQEMSDGFKKFNLFLSTQEVITLTDVLTKNDKGSYSMEDLYNLIVTY